MYTSFFGFDEKPFTINPDPRFLYLSESHKEALAHLIYGIKERKGFTVITGDVGTGKTTLINKLLDGLDPGVQKVFINNPDLSREDFFFAIAQSLEIEDGAAGKGKFLAAFEKYLHEADARGEQVVLIVDEAQNLPRTLLEEIRLLSNLETSRQKLLQIVLVGQQELNEKLSQPSLRQLRQRVSQKFHISPLNRQETEEYIEHRLGVSGYVGGQLFTGRAVARIHDASGGYPRLINVLCDNLLLAAYTREQRRIGASLVKEVAQEMEAAYPVKHKDAPRRTAHHQGNHRAAFYGFVVLAVFFFLFYFYRSGLAPW